MATWIAWDAIAKAEARIELLPIRLNGYEDEGIRFGYKLPCGAKFLGLVVQEDGGYRLRVAAAISRQDIVCTTTPQKRQVVVDFIATTAFAAIDTIPVDRRDKLKVLPVSELRILRRQAPSKLQAVYQDRCGVPVGTLIRIRAKSELELFVVEKSVSSKSGCQEAMRTQDIRAIKLKGSLKVRAGEYKSRPWRQTYGLRFAKIRKRSFRRDSGGLRMTFKRRCNEAPVGLVVGGEGPERVMLGMLVARYQDHPCPPGVEQLSWTRFETKDVVIPKETSIAFMAATAANGWLEVKTPVDLWRGRSGLKVHFFKGCKPTIGTVFRRDSYNNLAVGILTRRGGSPCKKPATEVSLSQPYLSKRVQMMDLSPMRLR